MSEDAVPTSAVPTSAAQLRAAIEATRRSLAETADALAARAARSAPEVAAPAATPEVATPVGTPRTVTPTPANLPVLYRADPARRRSVAVAGAVLAVAAMLVRRRFGR